MSTELMDLGIIRCICHSTEDDGFTIQCEKCLVWQHAFCVNITHDTIPEHYLCELCSRRKRPKLSKRIPIPKNKFKNLDAIVNEEEQRLKKKSKSSRIVSRYVYPIFKDAQERWHSNYVDREQHPTIPILVDYGPFVLMDTTTLLTKGSLMMDTPIYNNQGLYATTTIPSKRYLMEITGDIMLKSEFKFDPNNDFVLLGTPLSHIMFYPALDVCVDTRQFGNKAKYIRRSCHPNAELRNVLSTKDDKTIHLGLFARHLIEKGQEITVGWNWQRGHISWKENINWHNKQTKDNQVIDEEEERRKRVTIKNMLNRFEKEFGQCACINKRKCLIEYLKRQLKSTRKPNVNNIYAGRRKSSIILLKPKPLLEKLKSNTIIDTSDEEFDGDIDIINDLPTPTLQQPPPLDDHSDLSSLASLSSLSVFEDSDHEREKNIPNPIQPNMVLPRKKLWVRDYLSKHNNTKQDTNTQVDDNNKEEINEGELSDASTVLLDKEEIHKVYNNQTIPSSSSS